MIEHCIKLKRRKNVAFKKVTGNRAFRGGAQEDYDFHTKLLGLRSVKKTVLFDVTAPIYHL